MSREVDQSDRRLPGELVEIAEKYEQMIEDVRERVQQINERIRPLTDEIDLVGPPIK
jgi:hypothetical protein